MKSIDVSISHLFRRRIEMISSMPNLCYVFNR